MTREIEKEKCRTECGMGASLLYCPFKVHITFFGLDGVTPHLFASAPEVIV